MIKERVKNDIRKINIWQLLFAMMFSAMLIASRHTFDLKADRDTVDTVFITDFHFVDCVIWIAAAVIVYIALKGAAYVFASAASRFFTHNVGGGYRLFLFAALFLMMMWLPYLLSYFPGGIFSDTVDSINMALYQNALDNHNPILYTLLWRLLFWIAGTFSGRNVYAGLNLFTVVQTFVCALALSYFLFRCYRWGCNKLFIYLCLLVFSVFSLYPFYGISLWKDTPFSIMTFVFSVFLYDLFKNSPERISTRQLVMYCIGSVLIIFLRNNGIYVAAFYFVAVTLILLMMRRKNIAVKIGIASAVMLVVSGMIQGSVYDTLGYDINSHTESLGIPMQQVAYIISTDGKLTEDDIEEINNLMPLEKWRELYDPTIADYIKFSGDFNREYMENHAGKFLKTYVHIVLNNPVKAVKAYMLSTIGFWDVFENSGASYICNYNYPNADYVMSDYFASYFQYSFRNIVEPKKYISAAIFVWIMLGTVCICLAEHHYSGLLCVMPTMGLWLSVMLAVPLSYSFRYVYALFLCVPLYLIVCIDCFRKQV